MEGLGILWSVIVGILAGFLAGLVLKGRGFGLIVNLIVGLIGSVIGGWLYGLMGLGTGSVVGVLIMSTLGAIVFLGIISLFKRK